MSVALADKAEVTTIDNTYRFVVTVNSNNNVRNLTHAGFVALIATLDAASVGGTTPTPFGKSLIDDADASAARTTLGIDTNDAVTFGDLTVNNLTVNGTATTVNTASVTVDDPLIRLADNNPADSLDIGMYGLYVSSGSKYAGLFRDASDGKFKFFVGLTVEPTTTVDTGGSGYAVATVVANVEGNVNGVTLTAAGSSANFLNAAGSYATPPGSPPGGASGTVQYNNAGAFGGFGSWNSGSSLLTIAGNLDLSNSTSIYRIGGSNVLSAPSQNLFVGPNAGNGASGDYNVAVGPYCFFNNTGASFAVAAGWGAFQSPTSDAYGWVAIGLQAGEAVTTAHAGTYIGHKVGLVNDTGDGNTGGGWSSGFSIEDGFHNAWWGALSFFSAVSASNCVAIGESALYYVENGDSVTGFGYQAGVNGGNSHTNGNQCLYLGHAAAPSTATDLNNSTAMGPNARINEDNQIVLGDSAVESVCTWGSMLIGGITKPTGGGAPVLVLFDAVSDPTGMPANSAGVYSKSGEGYMIDASGNATLQTPHPTDAPPEMYDDVPGREDFLKTIQYFRGVITWRNISRGLRRTEPFELEETFAEYNARTGANLVALDWDAHEQSAVQKRIADQQDWDRANEIENERLEQWRQKALRRAALPPWMREPLERMPGRQDRERPADYVPRPKPASVES